MITTTRTGRANVRAHMLLLIVTLVLGFVAGVAPAIAGPAGAAVPVERAVPVEIAGLGKPAWPPPPAPARIRRQILWVTASQVGQRETGAEDSYPIRYRLNDQIGPPARPWCGIFAYWAWSKGGATRRPNMAGAGLDQGHFATYWQKWGKDNNRWKPITDRKVAVGDVVVYGRFPEPGHVGVVTDVWNVHGRAVAVRTVEGNLGDQVADTGWRNINELRGRDLKATGFVSPVQLPR